jgi:hypothetical protein
MQKWLFWEILIEHEAYLGWHFWKIKKIPNFSGYFLCVRELIVVYGRVAGTSPRSPAGSNPGHYIFLKVMCSIQWCICQFFLIIFSSFWASFWVFFSKYHNKTKSFICLVVSVHHLLCSASLLLRLLV